MDIDFIKSRLLYDSSTGAFTWIDGPNAGRKAGALKPHGYIEISIGPRGLAKCLLAHRIAWAVCYGSWPENQIDHINGNRADNRIENLRDVLPQTNAQNRRTHQSNNKVGKIGVFQKKGVGSFYFSVKIDGKLVKKGGFASAEDAHAAYLEIKRAKHVGCTI